MADPATEGLGDVLWIVDVNRQSLDRVVPGVRIAQWEQQFAAAGWHVLRFTWHQVTLRPEWVASRIAALVGQRS